MQPGDTALDNSIADMNKAVLQQLTSQKATSIQLQLQAQQNQAMKIMHMDVQRTLAESTQQGNLQSHFCEQFWSGLKGLQLLAYQMEWTTSPKL